MPWATWAIVVVVLVGGWWYVESGGERERQRIEDFIAAVAPTYAHELAEAGHSKLHTDTPADDPVMLTIRKKIDDWLLLDPGIADIYTMRALPNGQRMFIVDTDTDTNHDGVIEEHEKGAAPGEIFEEADAGLERALKGEPNFNPEVIKDKWGSWVGGWAPIWGADGKVEAVVGVDYDAAAWIAATQSARLNRILQLALLLGVTFASLTSTAILKADVAKRRAAEEELAKSENRLRLTVRQIPVAFVEIDTDGMIVAWNPSAEAMFGYSADEAVGKMHYEAIVEPAERPRVGALIRALMENRTLERNVNDNIARDGRVIRCEWLNAQVLGPDGKVLSVVCLAQDITQRLNLEEQLRQSQRMTAIGQLAAGVAHDFNNLLTVIQGHVQLLLDRDELSEEAREDAEHISAASERAGNLTRQLLSFSRKQTLMVRPVELNAAVRSAAHLLERTLGAAIHVRCKLAEDLPAVEADLAMLDQVMTNLAVNARDAMPGGGILTFATLCVDFHAEQAREHPERRPGRFVKLEVSDSGTGIENGVMPRIFEPFFTTKDIGKGTGLGLAAVHGIVKQHGGWIEVRSKVGAGTTFEILLPASEKSAGEALLSPISRIQQVDSGMTTILVVEDDDTVRNLAKVALERAGYRAITAPDGPSAERIWASQPSKIDVLVTDLVMPNGITGRDLAIRLLADVPQMPVVYASGYSIESTLPDFSETPTQTFLQKPYLPGQLIGAVRRVLAANQVAS